jgi:hypothetical protein
VTPSGHCPHHETPEPVAFVVQQFLAALSSQATSSSSSSSSSFSSTVRDPAALRALMPDCEVRFYQGSLNPNAVLIVFKRAIESILVFII